MCVMMSKFLVFVLMVVLQFVVVGVVFFNFEDNIGVSQIGDCYVSILGVIFSGDVWGIMFKFNNCGGIVQFLCDGSCGGLELVFDLLLSGSVDMQSFIVDLVGGFVKEFFFVYFVCVDVVVQIDFFDGVNGIGCVLQILFNLVGVNCMIIGVCFCVWNIFSIQFDGVVCLFIVSVLD